MILSDPQTFAGSGIRKVSVVHDVLAACRDETKYAILMYIALDKR